MISSELILVLVAAVSFYLGYRMGRLTAASEMDRPVSDHERSGQHPASPLPGPGAPASHSSVPPPASAGDEPGAGRKEGEAPRLTPRRTAAPPPARAGLLDKEK